MFVSTSRSPPLTEWVAGLFELLGQRWRNDGLYSGIVKCFVPVLVACWVEVVRELEANGSGNGSGRCYDMGVVVCTYVVV